MKAPVPQLYATEEDIIKLQIKRILYAEGDHKTQYEECVSFLKDELLTLLHLVCKPIQPRQPAAKRPRDEKDSDESDSSSEHSEAEFALDSNLFDYLFDKINFLHKKLKQQAKDAKTAMKEVEAPDKVREELVG